MPYFSHSFFFYLKWFHNDLFMTLIFFFFFSPDTYYVPYFACLMTFGIALRNIFTCELMKQINGQ